MDYLLHVIILVSLYGILSLGLNLILGFTGLPSLGHAAFFAVGAYTTAILCTQLSLPPLAGILVAGLLAGMLAVAIALITLRMEKDYFALATLAFAIVVYSLAKNLPSLTEGPRGIAGIPPIKVWSLTFTSPGSFSILCIVFVIVLLILLRRLVLLPYGKCLTAIRDDEIVAKTLSIKSSRFKVQVFFIGGISAGFAGALYAHYISYINPNNFTLLESITVLLIVILGGSGTLSGPLLGSVVIIGLPELLRFVGFPFELAAYLRQITFGLILILLVLFRPRGLIGKRSLV